MASEHEVPGERLDVDYCRISDDRAGAGGGVASQHEENVEAAAESGRTITASYVDNDISAYSGTDRPQYERLLGDIASGRIASVTVWHANRLHRSTDEVNSFIKLAREHRVRLLSATKGGEYDLSRAAGRRALRDDTSEAEYESDHRGERIALARKRQARLGTYGGGVRPYGYGVDTGYVRRVCLNPKAAPEDREYEDRPVLDYTKARSDEAAEMQRWAEDLLAGISIASIVRDLNTRGVPSAKGMVGRWSSRTVTQILQSPRISGHAVYKGEITKRDAYDQIIPDDTRKALITLLTDPARRSSPGNVPKWLGSLIYRCGICDDDTTMTVHKTSTGTPIYRCRSKFHHCSRQATPLDAYIEEVVVARLARSDLADLISPRPNIDVAGMRERLAVLEQRKIEAAQLHASGDIDGAQLATSTAVLRSQAEEIRSRLAEAAGTSPLADFGGLGTTDAVREVWEGLTMRRRREVLRLLARVTVLPVRGRPKRGGFDPASVVITPKGPGQP